jgi:seryl-tRNA synthetase
LLDIKWIRENPDTFLKGLTDRGFPEPRETLNQILRLDEQRRGTIQKLQEAQARRNAASSGIGQAKAAKDEARANALMEEVAQLKIAIRDGEAKEREDDKAFQDYLAGIPNVPAADVPVGDETANKELHKVGTPPKFDFQPKQHFELGEALGLMDFETAAKLSGSRFVVLKGALARLERALSQFMLDLHTSEHGYTEINPPLLVRDDTMFGTAQLPKFAEDQFSTKLLRERPDPDSVVAPFQKFLLKSFELESFKKDYRPDITAWFERGGEQFRADIELKRVMRLWRNAIAHSQRPDAELQFRDYLKELFTKEICETLWLIPTAEVPLTNLVREGITDEAKLPIRVTAGTPCFRAEAGAAGKDTRGMIRQHQFSKVELVSITTPEQSPQEHERMTKSAETVLQKLGLPYRVVVLSTGDMGFASQKTYDIEVWLPGQGMYREISSCSNCGDFQARRMNARYRPQGAKDTRFVHTLNGSGVAVGRALIAVMENYQEPDGSIRIPDALKPYMGGLTKIEAPK